MNGLPLAQLWASQVFLPSAKVWFSKVSLQCPPGYETSFCVLHLSGMKDLPSHCSFILHKYSTQISGGAKNPNSWWDAHGWSAPSCCSLSPWNQGACVAFHTLAWSGVFSVPLGSHFKDELCLDHPRAPPHSSEILSIQFPRLGPHIHPTTSCSGTPEFVPLKLLSAWPMS